MKALKLNLFRPPARVPAARLISRLRSMGPFLLVLLLSLVWVPARGQTPTGPLTFDELSFLWNQNTAGGVIFYPGLNWQSFRGVPISSISNSPAGSDGREPTPIQQGAEGTNSTLFPLVGATAGQFDIFLGLGGVPAQGTTNLTAGSTVARSAVTLNWPRLTATNGGVVAVLRAAQVGAPFINLLKSYPFGSVIAPPITDENGNVLTNGANLTYWLAAPYSPPGVTNNTYYYSPNAGNVFATQPGQVAIIWEKTLPTATVPTNLPANVGYVQQGLAYYLLYTNTYLVSGTPVKAPQKMYWTEANYQATGYPISIPKAQVNVVNIIYSSTFPQFVPFPGDTAAFVGTATNTIWFDNSLNEIRADNVTGRIFIEFLGEPLSNGNRRFLGFEIVDVAAQPVPVDINVELGTRVPGYADGTDDSALKPSPLSSATGFFYRQSLPSGGVNLWATHYTANLNDFQAYWLNTGVAGLQWPFLFNRYHEYWPADPAEYVNYARPYVTNAAQAALTSVQLPISEAPTIAYQDFDSLVPNLAQLPSSGLFYTLLDLDHPAHRTLLQFISGGNVAYERVFSWLDWGLENNALLANSIATNLSAWNSNTLTLNFSNPANTPYVITNTVNVGDRITAPAGELGSGGGGVRGGFHSYELRQQL